MAKIFISIQIIIMITTQINAQTSSIDSLKIYLNAFQEKVQIPDGYHFYSAKKVIVNSQSALLFRYQKPSKEGTKQENSSNEHFSFIISENNRQILGFTYMDKKYSNLQMCSRENTAQIAKRFLAKMDNELANSLNNLWIERHDEQISNKKNPPSTIAGMKYKCYRASQNDYAWVIVGFDGSIITFERNIKWNNEKKVRITEKWLHDHWNASNNKKEAEKQQIKSLIEQCYLQGALNAMNTEEMLKGYHPNFAISFADGDSLNRLPLQDWITMIKDFKAKNTDYSLRQFTAEFLQIDITNNAAAVKLNLWRKNTLVFTDYITLIKFPKGWKIVTKIYHAHIPNPWGTN